MAPYEIPIDFQPTDQYAQWKWGKTIKDFYNEHPGYEQQYQQAQQAKDNLDPIKVAERARQYNIQANQPVVQQLQKTQTDLGSQYKQLLDSIKGNYNTATNAQTLATNNELGRRGISSDSGLYQQEMANAMRPIDSQFQSLAANTGLQQGKDMQDLALQIANLQSGNPAESLNFGQGVASQQQQANNLAAQIAAQQQQVAAQQRFQQIGYGGLYDASNGQTINSGAFKSVGAGGIYDPMTGQVIQGMKAAPAPSSQLNNNSGGNTNYYGSNRYSIVQ